MIKKYKGLSNIEILKKYISGERPFTIVGYTSPTIKRSVGEQYVDSKGVMWRQETGYKTRVNKQADIIRDAIRKKCSICNADARFGSRIDNILYRKTGLCSNCLIDYETKLRIVGVYDDYELYKLSANEIAFLKDTMDKIEETIKFFSEESGDVIAICNSDGFIERWKNTNKDKILEDAKRDLKLVRQRIIALTKIKTQHKKKFQTGAKKFNLETYV